MRERSAKVALLVRGGAGFLFLERGGLGGGLFLVLGRDLGGGGGLGILAGGGLGILAGGRGGGIGVDFHLIAAGKLAGLLHEHHKNAEHALILKMPAKKVGIRIRIAQKKVRTC